MLTMTFDTLAIAKQLAAGGFSVQQAETLTSTLREAGREDHLVTREYLDERLHGMEKRVDEKLETLGLRLTVKLGAMMFAGFGFLAALKFYG